MVAGGGIVGLCSAYELAKRGFQVTVLEAGREEDDSCSSGNAGMIVPSHFVPLAAPGMALYGLKMLGSRSSPFGFAWPPSLSTLSWGLKFLRSANAAHVSRTSPVLRDLNLASRALYVKLHEELGLDTLERKGLIMLCKSESAFHEERELAQKASSFGLKVQILSPDDLRSQEPGVQMDVAGGVHFLDDASLSPKTLLRHLRQKLDAMGVRLQYEAPVTGWNLGMDRIAAAETPKGEYPADDFVLAAGVVSGKLASSLNLKLPMVGGKGYGFTLPNPPIKMESCAILVEARVAVTPMDDGIRFAGTMELGAADGRVNPHRLAGIRSSIRSYYPGLAQTDLDSPEVWSGLRPCSPDGMPYLGRAKRWQNLVVASGHAMMGMSLGPISGEIVAQILSDQTTPIPLDTLDPNRYD